MLSRRTFLRATARLAGLGLAAGLYAWRVEPYWLEFTRTAMPIAHLPGHLAGKTLMQISDIHVGNRFNNEHLADSLRKSAELEPDIVVYTGDYVSREGPEQLRQLREVMAHAVHGKLGTVAILGNHDYGHRFGEPWVADAITAILEGAGITVLRNAATEVAGLHVIGFDDLWGSNFKPADALVDYEAERANLLLCHNPDVCDLDVWKGYQGWILAGHTHGGQCKPPFLPSPILPVKNKEYTAGEFDLKDGRRLYINRALGSSWPVRFNVRPEVAMFGLEIA